MKRQVVGLVGLQLVLVGLYVGVEALRRPEVPFPFEVLDEPAAALVWERQGGVGELDGGRVVVHFWATWCGPCRTELPSLLAAARAEGVTLLAVTDEDWETIEQFTGSPVPDAVVRDPNAARLWNVSGLPDTFLVEEGRVRARVDGPRDWSTSAARAFLEGSR